METSFVKGTVPPSAVGRNSRNAAGGREVAALCRFRAGTGAGIEGRKGAFIETPNATSTSVGEPAEVPLRLLRVRFTGRIDQSLGLEQSPLLSVGQSWVCEALPQRIPRSLRWNDLVH